MFTGVFFLKIPRTWSNKRTPTAFWFSGNKSPGVVDFIDFILFYDNIKVWWNNYPQVVFCLSIFLYIRIFSFKQVTILNTRHPLEVSPLGIGQFQQWPLWTRPPRKFRGWKGNMSQLEGKESGGIFGENKFPPRCIYIYIHILCVYIVIYQIYRFLFVFVSAWGFWSLLTWTTSVC